MLKCFFKYGLYVFLIIGLFGCEEEAQTDCERLAERECECGDDLCPVDYENSLYLCEHAEEINGDTAVDYVECKIGCSEGSSCENFIECVYEVCLD